MTARSAGLVSTRPVAAVSAVATTWFMPPGVTRIARSARSARSAGAPGLSHRGRPVHRVLDRRDYLGDR